MSADEAACVVFLGGRDEDDDDAKRKGALYRARAVYAGATRMAAHSVFVVVMLGSCLARLAPLALAVLDASFHCLLLASRGRVYVPDRPALSRLASASLHAHPDTLVRGFHFRTSAADVAALAVLRAAAAVLAWGVLSSRANLFRPYLLSSYLATLATAALVAVKAPQYHYAASRGPRWLAPLLFGTSLLAALGHVALASHAAASSRRRRSHLEQCNSAEECWAAPVPAGCAPAATSRPAAAHRRRQSREDVEACLREAGDAADVPPSALADADSCFADCDGVAGVHYKVLPPPPGAPDDAAVLLIHAFGGGEHAWRHAAPLLARRCGVRVIAFDRCGFGLSGRPVRDGAPPGEGSPYSLHAGARVAVALCRALGVRRVALVGHADGATLALLTAALLRTEAAAADAVRCAGLALLAPCATGEVVPTSTRLLLKSSVGLPLLRPLLRSEVGEAALRRAFHCPAKLTPHVIGRYAEATRVLGWDRALWEVARCAGELPPGELAALAEGAAAARTPALVVGGAQDRLSPPEVAAATARALGPGCECVMLPECGSMPHEETPGALVAVLAPAISAWLGAEAAPLCDSGPASPTEAAPPSPRGAAAV